MDTINTLAELGNQLSSSAPEQLQPIIPGDNQEILVDGIEQSIDNIFSAVCVGGIDRSNMDLMKSKLEVFKQAYSKFKSLYTKNVFKNEYAFLHSVLTQLKISVFTWPQLEQIIDNSADDILSSESIDLSNFATFNGVASTDEEKLEAFKYLVKDKFEKLSNAQVTIEEFDSSCIIYNQHYRDTSMIELINDMAIIMSSGLSKRVGKGRKRVWKGTADAQEYYRLQKAEIDSLEDKDNRVVSMTLDEKWLQSELEDKSNDDKEPLIDTGLVEIDSIHGSLHRGNIFETLGPPKGGKTTFTVYMAERCLAAGLNVAIWPLEGTKEEWTAHIVSNILRKQGRKNVTKKEVLEESYKNDIDRQLAASAKAELAMGKGRGKLSFIEGVCYVEDMVDVLMSHYNENNAFDVIIMDSPLLVLSKTGRSKVDRIGEAYTVLKNFVNNKLTRKALALVTAQLKQSVIDNVRQDPKYEIDVTAGGESAESIRTPDYVVCLISTKEERDNHLAKFCDVATRHTNNFKSFYARAEFGSATFYSDSGLNSI